MCAAWLRENRIHSLLLLAKQDAYMLCFCTCFRPPLFSLFSSIVIIILVHKNKLQSFTSAFIILFHRSLATQVSTFYHQPSTISFKTKTYFSTISFKWSDRQYERGEERKIIRRCVLNDWQCSFKKKFVCVRRLLRNSPTNDCSLHLEAVSLLMLNWIHSILFF